MTMIVAATPRTPSRTSSSVEIAAASPTLNWVSSIRYTTVNGVSAALRTPNVDAYA
jgi:hypothetical protein